MSRREIGSFFEQENICIKERKEMPDDGLLHQLVCCGRDAIELALTDIEQRNEAREKTCILPIYTCDTVVIPFVKRGWNIRFYKVKHNLQIDKEYFASLLFEEKPSVLLMHSYYGADTLSNVRDDIKKAQNEFGLIFIEDMTQSLGLYGSITGADYYVGSLRKWLAIPDGGFLCGKSNIDAKIGNENKQFVDLKREAQYQKREYLKGDKGVLKDVFLSINRQAEDLLYQQKEISKMSKYSRELLNMMDIRKNLEIRTENGRFLDDRVREIKNIRPVLESKAQGYLYYPIYVEDRNELQEFLRSEDIFAPVLWPVDSLVEEVLDDETRYIYDHLLALPCDQRYSVQDMERMICCLKTYEGQCKEDVR